mgnify:CR=1 FL=1
MDVKVAHAALAVLFRTRTTIRTRYIFFCDISIIHVATPIKAYLSVKLHKIYRFSLLSWPPRKSIIAVFTLKLKLICVVLSVF